VGKAAGEEPDGFAVGTNLLSIGNFGRSELTLAGLVGRGALEVPGAGTESMVEGLASGRVTVTGINTVAEPTGVSICIFCELPGRVATKPTAPAASNAAPMRRMGVRFGARVGDSIAD
jgi:hypothetical protein